MKDGELTYDDFLQRLDIQDILLDAGYCQNRRDGLRYPSYVRMGSDGRRIRGDKFIVTQQGRCCFQPPHQKVYNIISFIKAHPQLFAEYSAGMDPNRLVNLVCNRLLNHPIENREARIIRPARDVRPFDIGNYDLHRFDPQDRHKRNSTPTSRVEVSTYIRSTLSTGTSVWRPRSGTTACGTPTSPFR